MELNKISAKNLTVIDRELGDYIRSDEKNPIFTPAQYEIVRRAIYYTGDFEYQSLIQFSPKALLIGGAALAARSTIIVDNLMIKAGILSILQRTFANQVYCSLDSMLEEELENHHSVCRIEYFAKHYPEGIFIIGQEQNTLSKLLDLIELEEIEPAFILGTTPGFLGIEKIKQRLGESSIPNILIDGSKGGAIVSVGIMEALIELSWQVYYQNNHS